MTNEQQLKWGGIAVSNLRKHYAVACQTPLGLDGWYATATSAESALLVWRKRYPDSDMAIISTLRPYAFPDSKSLPCLYYRGE